MNLNNILATGALVLAVMTLSACNSNKVTEWRDTRTYEGDGGAVETIEGIDVWTVGTPQRKFKVIAYIEHSHRSGGLVGIINSFTWKSSVAKKAKELGGDAVILSSQTRQLRGFVGSQSGQATAIGNTATYSGTSQTTAVYSDKARILVARYVE